MFGPLRSLLSAFAGSLPAGERGLFRSPVLAVAVVLVLLLATTGAAVPLTSDASSNTGLGTPVGSSSAPAPIVQEENTTARLVLPDSTTSRSAFGTVTLDVAGSTAVQTARIHGTYATMELREEFAAAETETQQRAVVESTVTELDARIDDLEARQAAALAAYTAGTLSTEGLLRELAAIDTNARALEETIRQLYTFNRAIGKPVPASKVAQLKSRLIPLQGPVRERLAASMDADGEPIRVYVTASADGVVLSTIVEDDFSTQYLREAFFAPGFDDRFVDKPISFEEFESRVEQLYPWVFDQSPPYDTVLTSEPFYVRAGVYGIAINHPHGTVNERDLVIYYDAGTQDVFYEIQRKDVSTVPTEPVAESTDEGRTIELRATHQDGPLQVLVTDAETGVPVDATVSVNGQNVGTTDGGALWTIAPRGTFVVTATTEGGNVTVSATNV